MKNLPYYKIIIPKEEPNETLEEAAEKWCKKNNCGYGGFISDSFENGAKWYQERSYSLDEIKDAMKNGYGIKYFSEHKFLKNLNNLKNKN